MTLWRAVVVLGGLVIGSLVVAWLVFAFWRVRSELRRRAAGEAPLQSRAAVIWRDPGPPEKRDLVAGPGGRDGAPRAPFQFVEEHLSGSFPCVSVRDARGRVWRVKWGDEVHTEVFGTRFAWAAGYCVEVNYFVRAGQIDGAGTLQRARPFIEPSGEFRDARFELDDPNVVTHFDEHSWAWNDNPFLGTPELNGLKIVMMLLSNWDNKDVRDVARGSNTAIFEYRVGKGALEARYLIIDWGAALGAWGSNVITRGRWDVEAFAAQSDQFILGVDGEIVRWGYKGQRTADAVEGVTTADVRWLYGIVGRITDEQLAAGLKASGGTETEIAGFTKALRTRLNQLAEAADKI